MNVKYRLWTSLVKFVRPSWPEEKLLGTIRRYISIKINQRAGNVNSQRQKFHPYMLIDTRLVYNPSFAYRKSRGPQILVRYYMSVVVNFETEVVYVGKLTPTEYKCIFIVDRPE